MSTTPDGPIKRHSDTTILTLEISEGDVAKLIDAFTNGKLADLGVIDIRVPSGTAPRGWVTGELHNRQQLTKPHRTSD